MIVCSCAIERPLPEPLHRYPLLAFADRCAAVQGAARWIGRVVGEEHGVARDRTNFHGDVGEHRRAHALPATAEYGRPRAVLGSEVVVMRLVLFILGVAQNLYPLRVRGRPVQKRGDSRIQARAERGLVALEEHARAGSRVVH